MNDLFPHALMQTLLTRAAQVVEDALHGRKLSHEPCPDPSLEDARGVFVTLRRGDSLAGCIGYPVAPWSLWDTLAEAARSAAVEDSRFDRIPLEELDEVELEISVLTPPREITAEEFEVGRHGLCLEAPGHRGLLLPQVAPEHGLDREGFLDALCRKAGLVEGAWRGEECRLLAFEAQILNAPLRGPGTAPRRGRGEDGP